MYIIYRTNITTLLLCVGRLVKNCVRIEYIMKVGKCADKLKWLTSVYQLIHFLPCTNPWKFENTQVKEACYKLFFVGIKFSWQSKN